METLVANHKPDYTNTHPPFDIGFQPAWAEANRIVSLDPWGHLAQTAFKPVSFAVLTCQPFCPMTGS